MKYLVILTWCLLLFAYEPTVHRQFFDGTEGHITYKTSHYDNVQEERLLAGLTLAAYGQSRGMGAVEVNFVNLLRGMKDDEGLSYETPLEELQIATRFISKTLLQDRQNPNSAQLYWMIEARGDIKFVVVKIPQVPLVNLSSMQGLRESQRRFYLSSGASYHIHEDIILGFKSSTITDEVKLDGGGSDLELSWKTTLKGEYLFGDRYGLRGGINTSAYSAKHHKPYYEIVLHGRTPIVSERIPICLNVAYKNIWRKNNSNQTSEFLISLIAINL